LKATTKRSSSSNKDHTSPKYLNHHKTNMSNPLDTDAGSELFSSYEAELKLVQADLSQKLDQIPDLAGEPRKAAISQAERVLEEASELVGYSD
jgi:chromosome condensin MukBEF complex kleisin-like MukF subunit